ncbi:MAG: hypothetical protein ABI681_06010 [Gemmatimonadales bacterium]
MTQAPASIENRVAWPWGTNEPTTRKRVVVAATIAVLMCATFYVIHFVNQVLDPAQPMHSDFSPVWYGAHALREGQNPYDLIGPGMQIQSRWPALYPATAYVLALPFTLIGEKWASVLFVGVSSFLLVFGATRDSWHRLPMFASVPFLTGIILGQLSVIITAVLFLPWLAVISCAKPQIALPMIITSKQRILIAAVGGAVVLGISLIMLPGWPQQWLGFVRHTPQFRPPIVNFGGFLILLILLRWRRPETWIIATMAVMPQSWYPYNWIVLLAVPNTYREAMLLTIISSAGGLAGEYAVYGMPRLAMWQVGGAFSVAFAYLPATLMILGRPNIRDAQRLR